ncbi:MAG: N-acyl homoserine lactonase family protein [Anaerovoracaceae bacterium]
MSSEKDSKAMEMVQELIHPSTKERALLNQIVGAVDASIDSVQDTLGIKKEWEESKEPIDLYDPSVDKDPPIKLHVLHLGDTLVDECNIFSDVATTINPLGGYRFGRNHEKFDITIPVTAYLIEHPKGRVLIDTGFNSRVRTDPVGELTEIHYTINPPVQKEGEAVDEVLASMGIKPEDLDYVVLSHMHTDHASGLQLVKNAKKLLVSDLEYAGAQKNPMAFLPHMWEGTGLETFKLEKTGIGPQGMSFDLFGDGTVVFVLMLGHTEGQCGTIISNNGKKIVLTADIGYGAISWRQMIMPKVVSSREEMADSMIWIREMEQRDDVIACLSNHEKFLKSREYIF